MAEPVRSPLYDVQAAAGAEFEDFDGWLWTAHLGDVMGEYEAIRGGAGLWDVYPLVKWDFTGPDAVRAAQRVFTNDVIGLQTGQVRYGAFTDETGNMVDDGTIYKLADDHCWVMTNMPGYDEYFAKAMGGLDVSIVNRTEEMPLVSLQGPESRAVLSKLTDADLTGLGYFRFLPERVDVAGIPAWLLRTGFSGELGYEWRARFAQTTKADDRLEIRLSSPWAAATLGVFAPDGSADKRWRAATSGVTSRSSRPRQRMSASLS